ncbi:tRNA epoxyqueuosine(34) reductase QueG [Asticcacaulis sp. ZE23SCel15]|uniref:tRNA epoxyqueuosine(34) reductase QueG n=1 Tax=Asticcacaulis sp. ZE23SCel15 TaxID=3059027 RepID=UPI00265E25F1|nr:tRNA epoxyqueuosine(34) reductase QueG [Asticcacaulis sp. ZE23SCel15]WKL57992.1 tRNA epoxyqueuosine(34) reductase QueG [Asticcacaulis sp. ZE23SCel15]
MKAKPKKLPPEAFKAVVRTEALTLGFADLRFLDIPSSWSASERLKAFVEAGLHGQMQWMEDTLERRAHPTAMWPDAKSAIVLGFNYGPDTDPLEQLQHPHTANISVYARGDDYHDLIKKKLKALGGFIAQNFDCQLKVFVDTAPLMEKPLAHLSGLGWQGKHTNLVSRQFGSWLFLGVILTDHVLDSDAYEPDHCGSCQACLEACPTDAFIGPYQLDARKCLSYLTIEHKGAWPEVFRHQMGNRIYGCDDCLAACPWNKFAQTTQEIKLAQRDGFDQLRLTDLAQLDDEAFRALFAKSPIKRIGLASFLRNVHYAIGNALAGTENDEMIAVLNDNLTREHPVVRASAVWALKQGMAADVFAVLRARHMDEADPDVRAEWDGL